MRIIQYCQHVLGMGHYFRTLEIARALHRHELVLVTGGPPLEVKLPSHVAEYRLPGLQMDAAFTVISSTDKNRSLGEVKALSTLKSNSNDSSSSRVLTMTAVVSWASRTKTEAKLCKVYSEVFCRM